MSPGTALLLAAPGSIDPVAAMGYTAIGRQLVRRLDTPPSVRLCAWTSVSVRRRLQLRGYRPLSPLKALALLAARGQDEVVALALHLARGSEYEALAAAVRRWRQRGLRIALTRPPLADQQATTDLLQGIVRELPQPLAADEALILVAHGSSTPEGRCDLQRAARIARQLDRRLLLVTVSDPAASAGVIEQCHRQAIKRAIIRPLLVSGTTTLRQISAAVSDGWLSRLSAAGVAVALQPQTSGTTPALLDFWYSQLTAALGRFEAAY